MCSKKCLFSCRHNALWCSSLGIAMLLTMVDGPSTESSSLISQTHFFFIGRFYRFSRYQHYKRMMNAYFFFSYSNPLEGSQRSIVEVQMCDKVQGSNLSRFYLQFSLTVLFSLHMILQGWAGPSLSSGHLQTLFLWRWLQETLFLWRWLWECIYT